MTVGFIGLGIMGKPMAKNLVKAGYNLIILDRHKDTTNDFLSIGASANSSVAEITEKSDVIITMLPNSQDVKDVALGKSGIIEAAAPGKVLIDMSSIAPQVSRDIASQLSARKMDMLDAPVSGGEPKAIDGTIAVMVGGDKKVFDANYSILKAMAGSVVHVGDIGAGNTTKLCNQVIVALNIAALSEALILASKSGVNPDLVYKAIRGGLAGSTVMDAKTPMILDRNFDPGFRIDLHIKDLSNVLDTSRNLNIPLPLSAQVMEIMQAIRQDGAGAQDHSAIVKFYEKLANIVVTKDD